MELSNRQLETVIQVDALHTLREPLETYLNPLWWQLKGLLYTATGYGDKIPTEYMVKHNNRLKRVYIHIFSNCGSLYIFSKGERIAIDEV